MSARPEPPIAPDDPRMRTYTEPEVTALLAELHERGRPLGIVWPSATTAGMVDGRVLVRFGHASTATVLNLLDVFTLLKSRDHDHADDNDGTAAPSWDS
ncbi:hypothetical protein [Streptomyces sp. BE20]|uniref:hypothetical protein n=1 Tax=Streptomycetaceae TaxID=2062 RepID=UPI002E79D1AD|nr:hypothetical protein [Streptomyces sp. BE20]MEE1823270.1 hypothetical protein [Streptomyces sp. BE20]